MKIKERNVKQRAVGRLGRIIWRKHILPKSYFLWAALEKFDQDHGFFLSSCLPVF
jgi:hypothetical protein